jgi:putative nucleotidyltransferase with HDIG domain
MTGRDLGNLKDRFSKYVRTFYSPVPEEQRNIALKEKHTFEVCKTIRLLAEEQSIGRDKVLLAETIGLFHDIGRFPQYARYKTFRDGISVNHGRLGAEILVEEGFLSGLDARESDIVISAVRFHNSFILPPLKDTETIFFLRLIRDADKLDIWRVFLDFFEGSKGDQASAAGLGLPDTPGYTDAVLACIYEKKCASHGLLRNLNDFKLLQISWVFDMNFGASFRLLLENRYIERLFGLLPQTDEVLRASGFLQGYISRRSGARDESAARNSS